MENQIDSINFPIDLWFNEAEQVIAFLKEKQYTKVNIIGSSGGALVAINIDWEQVIDNDINTIIRHEREIGTFFHRSLKSLKSDILLTGSKEDEFVSAVAPCLTPLWFNL